MNASSAWSILQLPFRLDLPADEIESQFRLLSEGCHPDAGGVAGEFERLREARDQLKEPFNRLDSWLEQYDIKRSHSEVISESVGEMFCKVNEAKQSAREWLNTGETVSSGLGKALWQKKGFELKSLLEELLGLVEEWHHRLCEGFVHLQRQGEEGHFEQALQVRSELAFLRKWRQELQSYYGQLWEGLV